MIKPVGMNRRDFLLSCALAGVGYSCAPVASHSTTRRVAASDRVRVAVIGLGRRGSAQMTACLQNPDAEIAALCDTNEDALRAAICGLTKAQNNKPLAYADFRRVLDRKDIDVVAVAAPSDWSAAMAIAACQAGKDVYMEQPCVRSLAEGRRLTDAARTADCLVQQGYDVTFLAAPELQAQLDGLGLGEVYRVTGWRRGYQVLPTKENNLRDAAGASGVGAWLLSEIDFARSMLGVGLPNHVATVGLIDERSNRLRHFSCQLRFGYTGERSKTIELSAQPAVGISGAQGIDSTSVLLVETARGDFTVRSDSTAAARSLARLVHWRNFIACVRTRQSDGLIAPLEEAKQACGLAYLVEVALRHRRGFSFDPAAEVAVEDAVINAYFRDQNLDRDV
jgi:predicted dehydrogenase